MNSRYVIGCRDVVVHNRWGRKHDSKSRQEDCTVQKQGCSGNGSQGQPRIRSTDNPTVMRYIESQCWKLMQNNFVHGQAQAEPG